MGFKASLNLIKSVLQKAKYITPKCEVVSAETLGLELKYLTGDIARFNETIPELSEELTKRLNSKANGMKLLKNSMREFERLKQYPIQHEISTILNEGDFVHGTFYDEKILDSILKNGVISGEIGYKGKTIIPEDCETFGCADFFTIPEKMDIKKYFGEFVNRRCGICQSPEKSCLPFYSTLGRQKKIAIISDAKKLQEDSSILLENSATMETLKDSPLAGIIQQFPDYKNHRAVLFGVPSQYISKIVVGNGLSIEEISKIKDIIKKYNLNINIYNVEGQIL